MELRGARIRDPKSLSRADSSRTLLDVIRDDPPAKDGHRSWRHFKEKLKRRDDSGGRGSAWTSTVPVPASDIPIRASSLGPSSARISPIHDQTDPPPDTSAAASVRRLQREENMNEDDDVEEEGERAPPVRMSLMSLLAETDEKIGMDGLAYMMEDEDEEEDEEEEDGGGEYNCCCVCMVRHRGAAFMPCGHSFCRLCSREMWVEERGNKCPLCNNYILEILDVF